MYKARMVTTLLDDLFAASLLAEVVEDVSHERHRQERQEDG
jgi:hypothetical protein